MKRSLVLLLALLVPGLARAQDKEPAAIFELGGAASWGVDGGSAYGPSVAVETTPIPEWLELEAGTAEMFSHGQTEWDTDLLFKKPFDLSRNFEFMFGLGPEWQHTRVAGKSSDTVAGEVALDFMFWPWRGRKLGLFVEPVYDYGFSHGHEQSLGVSAGLLIPFG